MLSLVVFLQKLLEELMTKKNDSYKDIIKGTSIFGGVQVFTIIISIIRSKFVAILLNPSGMGVMGLLTSMINLVSTLTSFGIRRVAVRDVAVANESDDIVKVSLIAINIRRLVWATGLLGSLLLIVFSKSLSRLAFDNTNFSFAFIWLSISVLLNQLANGQVVILQGLRKLQSLAKSTMLGSFLSLFFVIPLYYIYGEEGIVPSMILTSFIAYSLTWYYSRKVKLQKVKVGYKETIIESFDMLKMGVVLSISSFLSVGVSVLVRIYINRLGGAEQVGLYAAGFAIINTYVGLVFTAMGTDFYPRLSSIAKDNVLVKKLINQQAEIAILIIAPILIVLIVFIEFVIILLYSSKFLAIKDMIYWAVLGILFKAVSWSIGIVFLSKGDRVLFFWNEVLSLTYMLLLNIIGYYYYGLTGLGISFMIIYMLHFLQQFVLANKYYSFSINKELITIFIIQFFLSVFSFIVIKSFSHPYTYILGGGIIMVSFWYSYYELNKRINVRGLLLKFLKKQKKV